jgi:hypothetical protein
MSVMFLCLILFFPLRHRFLSFSDHWIIMATASGGYRQAGWCLGGLLLAAYLGAFCFRMGLLRALNAALPVAGILGSLLGSCGTALGDSGALLLHNTGCGRCLRDVRKRGLGDASVWEPPVVLSEDWRWWENCVHTSLLG